MNNEKNRESKGEEFIVQKNTGNYNINRGGEVLSLNGRIYILFNYCLTFKLFLKKKTWCYAQRIFICLM